MINYKWSSCIYKYRYISIHTDTLDNKDVHTVCVFRGRDRKFQVGAGQFEGKHEQRMKC